MILCAFYNLLIETLEFEYLIVIPSLIAVILITKYNLYPLLNRSPDLMNEVHTVSSEHPKCAGQESGINLGHTSLRSSEFSNEVNDKLQRHAAFFTPSLQTGQTKQKQVSNEGHKKSEHTLRKENALFALNVSFGVGLACGMIGVPLVFFDLFVMGVTLSSMAAGFMALGIVMAFYILHSERKDERMNSAISCTI